MKRKALLAIGLVCGMTLSLNAQHAVPPPPRPPDSGPSLEATMQFIQTKLNEIGRVAFVAPWTNTADNTTGSNSWTIEVTQVTAAADTCYVGYQWVQTRDGATVQSGGFGTDLKTAQDVVVRPYEQYLSEINSLLGAPNFIPGATNPSLVVLEVRRSSKDYVFFPFMDASLADRVAKAFNHAIERCGGGNKDPF